jgi:hypothetical protein
VYIEKVLFNTEYSKNDVLVPSITLWQQQPAGFQRCQPCFLAPEVSLMTLYVTDRKGSFWVLVIKKTGLTALKAGGLLLPQGQNEPFLSVTYKVMSETSGAIEMPALLLE